jgi:hypothetical protein
MNNKLLLFVSMYARRIFERNIDNIYEQGYIRSEYLMGKFKNDCKSYDFCSVAKEEFGLDLNKMAMKPAQHQVFEKMILINEYLILSGKPIMDWRLYSPEYVLNHYVYMSIDTWGLEKLESIMDAEVSDWESCSSDSGESRESFDHKGNLIHISSEGDIEVLDRSSWKCGSCAACQFCMDTLI